MNMRGVTEGFYGPPWTHQDRLDLLRFRGTHGLNTWVHAPRDRARSRTERALQEHGAEVVEALGEPAREVTAPGDVPALIDALALGVDAATGAALLKPFA